jgi:lipopolysaccharide biosynthesis regulator YciM
MYGRAGDLLKLNRDRNNPELSMFQRKQADEAHAKIVRQLKNKPLMRMRLRLINATRAGDLEEAAKIQIGMRALMKEDQETGQ